MKWLNSALFIRYEIEPELLLINELDGRQGAEDIPEGIKDFVDELLPKLDIIHGVLPKNRTMWYESLAATTDSHFTWYIIRGHVIHTEMFRCFSIISAELLQGRCLPASQTAMVFSSTPSTSAILSCDKP
jgi:hypothetical protein